MILNQEPGRGERKLLPPPAPGSQQRPLWWAPDPREWLAGAQDIFMWGVSAREQLSACPPGKVAAAYLTGEPRALGSRVNTPLASLTKSCFPNTQPLIRPPGGKALLLGNVVLSVRSAQRPVRGDCITSSPICLRKHLQRLPIKVLLFFLGRCLF